MRRWIRRLSMVAALLLVLSSLHLVMAPSAAAYEISGVAESSASWTNPSTGTRHTFHWRFAVERDTAPSPDRWRYRSRTWCDYKLSGGSTVYAERCNFNMFNSVLQIKRCYVTESCRIEEPWGRANWEIDDVTEKVWTGGWHSVSGGGLVSFRSATYSMQARFRLPNHVTNWYVGCSQWTVGSSYTQLPC
jgi:hypothetical protein